MRCTLYTMQRVQCGWSAMIEIILSAAKERIPTMSDSELAAACSEVMRLRDFSMLDVVNPDDVEELFALLGVEVERRKLLDQQVAIAMQRRKTDVRRF